MMKNGTWLRTVTMATAAALVAALAATMPAARAGDMATHSVSIGDITRLESQRINKLHGLGLVVGLKGSGDDGKYQPAIRPLAAMLQKLHDPVAGAIELKDTKNVALVTVTATIPAGGVRAGDRIDVQVQSVGNAKSLQGGRLFICPLQPLSADPTKVATVYALAEGAIRLEDKNIPTVGLVDGGAVFEEEVTTLAIENNLVRLVINDSESSFTIAAEIARTINAEFEIQTNNRTIARALDGRTVEIMVPEADRRDPVAFLSRIEQLPALMPRFPQARVEINERTGTIVMTGNVEVGASVISHGMLVVTTQSMTSATAASFTPTMSTVSTATTNTVTPGGGLNDGPFFGLDPTGEGGTKLQDLVTAMNVLKVPAPDRIAIIKQLVKAGRIHAQVTFAD